MSSTSRPRSKAHEACRRFSPSQIPDSRWASGSRRRLTVLPEGLTRIRLSIDVHDWVLSCEDCSYSCLWSRRHIEAFLKLDRPSIRGIPGHSLLRAVPRNSRPAPLLHSHVQYFQMWCNLASPWRNLQLFPAVTPVRPRETLSAGCPVTQARQQVA